VKLDLGNIDAKRGAVIGAAYHLMQFLNTEVGHTKDWPVQIQVDEPEKAQELRRLLQETNTALEGLLNR
jgi:hypothetical protein